MPASPDPRVASIIASHPPIVPPPTVFAPTAPVSQQSSSSGAKKRRVQLADEDVTSVASSGPSAFSQSVKQRVAKLDGAYCWQCGATPVQTCHVIGKKDNSFKKMIQNGLITFTTVGDVDNAIPLCGLCHANFDDIYYPGFFYLPIDLEYFIETEKKNFAIRKSYLEATGQYMPRVSPNAGQYLMHQIQQGVVPENAIGGLYQRYTLRNYFPSEPGVTAPGLDTWIPGRGPEPPKQWHGAPMAAINRGFAVLGQGVWKNMGKEKALLRRLQDLYEKELPSITAGTGVATVGGGGSSGAGQEHATIGGNRENSGNQVQPPAQPPLQPGNVGTLSSKELHSNQSQKFATHGSVSGCTTDSGIGISSGTSKSKREVVSNQTATPSNSSSERRVTLTPNNPSATASGHHESWPDPEPQWKWGSSSSSASKAFLWSGTFNGVDD